MENLTSEIKRIIDLPLEQVDIEKAALLLLRINRNQIMYNNLVRKNMVEKAIYELKKHYEFRMQDEVLKKTAEMEVKVLEVITKNPVLNDEQATKEKTAKGIRADHDQLPDEIKAVYLENQNIFPRMRKLHEQLKLMNNQRPCDRYPYLEELLALDRQHRANWEIYDSHVIGSPVEKEKIEVADLKLVSAARKYLSTNKKKLINLEGEAKTELLQKMQERYSYLVATNSGVSDEQKEEYKSLGLNV